MCDSLKTNATIHHSRSSSHWVGGKTDESRYGKTTAKALSPSDAFRHHLANTNRGWMLCKSQWTRYNAALLSSLRNGAALASSCSEHLNMAVALGRRGHVSSKFEANAFSIEGLACSMEFHSASIRVTKPCTTRPTTYTNRMWTLRRAQTKNSKLLATRCIVAT